MIVLDTDVLSELTRPLPDRGVQAWVNSQSDAATFTTAVTAAELLYGVARLPEGVRRTALQTRVRFLLDEVFQGRVLPFDARDAAQYGHVVTTRERLGRPVGVPDAQIAAICLSRGATLATRNVRDFADTGVELVNPWEGGTA